MHYNNSVIVKQQNLITKSFNTQSRAVFDQKLSSDQHIKIKDNGKEVWSDGSPCYAIVNRQMISGVYKWEFLLFEDTNSECTCLGVAV